MTSPLYSHLLSWPGVSVRRMFGADCFLTNGRMFAFAYERGLVLKVPQEHYHEALALPAVIPFTMRGIPFGKWARFPDDDFPAWLRLAYEGVLAEPPTKRRRARSRPFGGRP